MMTNTEATAAVEMYQAAGVVTRELGFALDGLAGIESVPLADVADVVAAALARIQRAYAAAAWVRETYG